MNKMFNIKRNGEIMDLKELKQKIIQRIADEILIGEENYVFPERYAKINDFVNSLIEDEAEELIEELSRFIVDQIILGEYMGMKGKEDEENKFS